jgi:Flp pilus assembly secretin CpaC
MNQGGRRMMKFSVKLAALAILTMSFVVAHAAGQQPQTQNAPAPDQPQQTQNPPHVDTQPNPEMRQVEKTITDAFNQDPHMAYSRVKVHATDSEIVLSGVVLTAAAKDQAAQIATDHAGGKKVTNKIKVNPNIHPGPGI